MQISPPPFPDHLPAGYEELPEPVSYDPKVHLDLEFPQHTWTLKEFGYSDEDIAECASSIAVTSPFRILSETGIKDLYQIAHDLKSCRSSIPGARVPSHLAGGVYRSRFLRDLCACPVLLNHMSTIAGTRLAPHSMPSQQLYINYAPEDINKAIDSWHYDGIGFDYVLMMSDPRKLKGGDFEYFQGTKYEVAKLFNLETYQVRHGITDDLPADKVIKAQFPAAGYGIFQQGNMVVHRANKLLAPAERITIVPGQIALDMSTPDPTAKHDMPGYKEEAVCTELARHSAWIAQNKLQQFIENSYLSEDREKLITELDLAVSDITKTIHYLRNPEKSEP